MHPYWSKRLLQINSPVIFWQMEIRSGSFRQQKFRITKKTDVILGDFNVSVNSPFFTDLTSNARIISGISNCLFPMLLFLRKFKPFWTNPALECIKDLLNKPTSLFWILLSCDARLQEASFWVAKAPLQHFSPLYCCC